MLSRSDSALVDSSDYPSSLWIILAVLLVCWVGGAWFWTWSLAFRRGMRCRMRYLDTYIKSSLNILRIYSNTWQNINLTLLVEEIITFKDQYNAKDFIIFGSEVIIQVSSDLKTLLAYNYLNKCLYDIYIFIIIWQ